MCPMSVRVVSSQRGDRASTHRKLGVGAERKLADIVIVRIPPKLSSPSWGQITPEFM